MPQSSSLVTGGITVSAATLEPAVAWALSVAFHVPIPESVSAIATGVIAYVAHGALNYARSRIAAKAA